MGPNKRCTVGGLRVWFWATTYLLNFHPFLHSNFQLHQHVHPVQHLDTNVLKGKGGFLEPNKQGATGLVTSVSVSGRGGGGEGGERICKLSRQIYTQLGYAPPTHTQVQRSGPLMVSGPAFGRRP